MFTRRRSRRRCATRATGTQPRSRLVWVEQTTNVGGGRVWPLSTIDEVLAVAARTGCARTSTAPG